MGIESSGQWLETALMELCQKVETGLQLDGDIISGLVSYCEMASPLDAKEYLDNIIGEEAVKNISKEYLKRRGHPSIYSTSKDASSSNLHAYVKPKSDEGTVIIAKKPQRTQKENIASTSHDVRVKKESLEPQNALARNQSNSKKKKSGKVVSLAEAAKGSIVYQMGKPCSCQARRHRLVSNCLSCGKIVCEQEGEGPCNFCGALVLREGSTYAGLDEVIMPVTEAEAAAEAFAKRLVEYDRDSAARTTVIDDQSDYYEIDGNSWLSMEEKELLRKKREEVEEAERARSSKVVLTFDILGRKVLLNEDQASEELNNRILLQPPKGKDEIRMKPNPNLKIAPIFIDPGPRRIPNNKTANKDLGKSMCLETTGRIQHDVNLVDTL